MPHRKLYKSDISAVLFAFFFPVFATSIYFVVLNGGESQVQTFGYTICKFIQFAFPAWWVFEIQRRRKKRLNSDESELHAKTTERNVTTKTGRSITLPQSLVEGTLFGVLVFGLMVILYTLFFKPAGLIGPDTDYAVQIMQKVGGFGFGTPMRFLMLGLFISVMHSFLEEYYWRWFVYGQLRRMMPIGMAMLLGAIGFMLHHVILLATYFDWANPFTWLFSIGTAIGGIYWSWLYQRSGSLLGPWLSHAVIDAAIFVIGYDMIRHLMAA